MKRRENKPFTKCPYGGWWTNQCSYLLVPTSASAVISSNIIKSRFVMNLQRMHP